MLHKKEFTETSYVILNGKMADIKSAGEVMHYKGQIEIFDTLGAFKQRAMEYGIDISHLEIK